MSNLSQIEVLLPGLSPAEQLLLVDRLALELADATSSISSGMPGIDVRPEVCGGEARIVRTRIPVWLLEQARRLGKTNEDILAAYPTLRFDDLVHAWAFVRLNPQVIERQIRENEAA